MEKRRLWASLITTAFTLIVLCAVLTASTYAWFTFDPYTNVTPMEGRISDGDTNLLISEKEKEGFDVKCDLNPTDFPEKLYPVSTPDLTKFYTSTAQYDGISTQYGEITDNVGKRLIHGTVYLKCLGTGCDVYFNKNTLNLGEDIQVLAAGRLGLKITGKDEKTTTLIFKLDDLGSTANAAKITTVKSDKPVVVSGTDGDTPFTDDPAVPIGEYMLSAANSKKLCTLQTDEVAKVEYWLYMEGCDDECSNPLQYEDNTTNARQVTLVLGFAGKQLVKET